MLRDGEETFNLYQLWVIQGRLTYHATGYSADHVWQTLYRLCLSKLMQQSRLMRLGHLEATAKGFG